VNFCRKPQIAKETARYVVTLITPPLTLSNLNRKVSQFFCNLYQYMMTDHTRRPVSQILGKLMKYYKTKILFFVAFLFDRSPIRI
jgi:hypothetical protein